MELHLGLDGGGTSTRLAAADPGGRILGHWQFAATSLSRRTRQEVEAVLKTALQTALFQIGAAPSEVSAVCAGFSSAAAPERHAAYEAMLQARLPHARIQVLTDAELAWHGLTGGQDGVLVIAGTGSIAWGHYRGRTARTGGERPGSDPGSADDIVRQAVGLGLLNAPASGEFAALLPTLLRAAHPRADPIYEAAALDLVRLAEACARQLDWADPVAFTWGGVFEHVPAVRTCFERAWPHALGQPRATPIQAALRLAGALVSAA